MEARTTQHFNPESSSDVKMRCTCCKQGQLSTGILILLEHLRLHFDAPVTITSGPRCKAYNAKVGGAKHSEHLIRYDDGVMEDTDAVDIQVKGHTPTEVYAHIKQLPYANLLGLSKYKTFVHVDIRGHAARW